MHDLIARGFAEARREKGWTQEQAANVLRGRGLRAWRKGTVGQLEAGLRRPRLDEVLLMASALGVTVDKLFPGGDDERVELGDDAEVSPRWIREMLSGDLDRDDREIEEMPYARFPVDDILQEVLSQTQAERERLKALTAPIAKWAKQHDRRFRPSDRIAAFDAYDLRSEDGEDWAVVVARASDAERLAARRLGIEIVQVKYAAPVLWDGLDFDTERDRRVGDIDALEPRSRQARRGLATREMLAELRALFEEIVAHQEEGADGER